jgi:hypothetical protein
MFCRAGRLVRMLKITGLVPGVWQAARLLSQPAHCSLAKIVALAGEFCSHGGSSGGYLPEREPEEDAAARGPSGGASGSVAC